jgi:hypothetical protein
MATKLKIEGKSLGVDSATDGGKALLTIAASCVAAYELVGWFSMKEKTNDMVEV